MSDKTAPDQQEGPPPWEVRCGLLHKAWVQVRYHRRRQRFFDLLDKITKAATVVLGASLLGGQLGMHIPWLGASISSLGLLGLIFSYGDRKQLHKEISELAAKLVADIERVVPDKVDQEANAHWAAEFALLVAKSPPTLKTLTLMCEREHATADGHPDHVPLQPWYRRLVASFF